MVERVEVKIDGMYRGPGQSAPPEVRGWSEKFSASIIAGNTIGKIFFFISWYVIRIHVKLQVILSGSLLYTAA